MTAQNYVGNGVTPNPQETNGSNVEPKAKPELTEYLADLLSDTPSVADMRRNVRTWFLSSVGNWQENAGTDLATQIAHYELLDDFLAANL